MSRPVRVLLATSNDERRRAWTQALQTARCQVVESDGEGADEIDILVIDQPLADADLKLEEDRLSRGQLGVIAVGITLPADVSLPGDHSARELRLACLLLAEIVRLRRQREASRRQERVLTHLALSDPLTGLPNRRAWEQQLGQRLAESDAATWCLALVDIDHFGQINETQGHLAGDTCLKRIADRLSRAIRRGGLVARLGGDEFGLLLPRVEPEDAPALVDLIRIQSAEDGDAASGRPPVKLSAGWTNLTSPATKADLQAALERADEALRAAKRSGRNQIHPRA